MTLRYFLIIEYTVELTISVYYKLESMCIKPYMYSSMYYAIMDVVQWLFYFTKSLCYMFVMYYGTLNFSESTTFTVCWSATIF